MKTFYDFYTSLSRDELKTLHRFTDLAPIMIYHFVYTVFIHNYASAPLEFEVIDPDKLTQSLVPYKDKYPIEIKTRKQPFVCLEKVKQLGSIKDAYKKLVTKQSHKLSLLFINTSRFFEKEKIIALNEKAGMLFKVGENWEFSEELKEVLNWKKPAPQKF